MLLRVSLLSLISGRFLPRIRERGFHYLESGRVHVEVDTPSLVAATVHGSEPYGVTLEREDGTLRVACTCPHASSWGVACKHIWAAALMAQETGMLAGDGTPLRSLELKHVAAPAPLPATPGRSLPVPWLTARLPAARSGGPPEAPGTVEYWLDLEQSLAEGNVTVRANLRVGKPRPLALPRSRVRALPEPADQRILALLDAQSSEQGARHGDPAEVVRSPWGLPGTLAPMLLPLLCGTGRFRLRTDCPDAPAPPLRWDPRPWGLHLELARREGAEYLLSGHLTRADERVSLMDAEVLAEGSVALSGAALAPLRRRHVGGWIELLEASPGIPVPEKEVPELVRVLLSSGLSDMVTLPEEWRLQRAPVVPRPRLRLSMGETPCAHIHARLAFAYADQIVEHPAPAGDILDLEHRRVIPRDHDREQAARRRLIGLRLRSCRRAGPGMTWRLATRRFPSAVRALVEEKWTVEAEGKLYRPPTSWNTGVTSGVDWFGLRAHMECDGEVVPMPAILKALRSGESYVKLGDGSFGLLPEEWLGMFLPLADFAEEHEDHLRFRPSQAALLDALLAARADTALDEGFRAARDRLRSFAVPRPAEPSPGFTGELRGYQKEGLGWMHFLANLGFGGCLADDMGLGKTVQVLALLQRRRLAGESAKPALIVVPRSLVFNWKQEAARFTPDLPLRDQAGPDRTRDPSAFPPGACALVTYGTLLRDIQWLKDIPFDHVILDEAQAIKNAHSQLAKAARLLQADHRLALTGTPVENHAGELWSLFEFLNPGLLGSSRVLRRLAVKAPSAEQADLIARAVRPFILRRTKAQVAPELPERSEQTLPCVLESAQRRLYDELKVYYRNELARLYKDGDIVEARMLALQALLRLRQAACHPGLLDAARRDDASAKLEVLMPRLMELSREGHKALVFSQFTSFLSILKGRLDARGIRYAYLDGATRDRAGIVRRFQEDPDPGLFLISLKAGGVGLNLTAADYVFLLDPWWNPAVEAQAIDRTHRIGQTRRVIAFRLVARDTVEERILELQQRKRDLADSIIRADGGLIGRLTRRDLERLLS